MGRAKVVKMILKEPNFSKQYFMGQCNPNSCALVDGFLSLLFWGAKITTLVRLLEESKKRYAEQ